MTNFIQRTSGLLSKQECDGVIDFFESNKERQFGGCVGSQVRNDPKKKIDTEIIIDIKELFEDKSRYFYCAKTSKVERNQGLDNLPTKKASSMPGRRNPDDMKDSKIDNDVTGRFVTEKKNIHPTVKPIKLMKYLCRLITPKGGTVLDPFMGSGSTGMAAKEENFDFVGIEKEEEYFNIASARIESVDTKSTLEGFYE